MAPRHNLNALPFRPPNGARDNAWNASFPATHPPRPVLQSQNHGDAPTAHPNADNAQAYPSYQTYAYHDQWAQNNAWQGYRSYAPYYGLPQGPGYPSPLGFFQPNMGNSAVQPTYPNHQIDSLPERPPYDSRCGTEHYTSTIYDIDTSDRSSIHPATQLEPTAGVKGKRRRKNKQKGKARLDEASTAPKPAHDKKRNQDQNITHPALNTAQGNKRNQDLKSSLPTLNTAQGSRRSQDSKITSPPVPSAVQRKKRHRDPKIMLPAPVPSPEYLTTAAHEPSVANIPNRLLVILDLNGTLIFRPAQKGHKMIARPFVEPFLHYLFENFAVMVWSSARPHNVKVLVENVLGNALLSKLVGQWARDTLGLTVEQYNLNVQVYKNLDTVWGNEDVQHHNLGYDSGLRFGQHNTVLIDDSALKANAQPHNLLEIPEFTASPEDMKSDVLREVAGYLEVLRMQQDVSRFIRKEPFKADGQWTYNWPDAVAQGGPLKETTSLQERK